MVRSTKKRRIRPEKSGARRAVAEAKVFMTGRSQAVKEELERDKRLEKERQLTSGDSA